jgi:hypothetical protein
MPMARKISMGAPLVTQASGRPSRKYRVLV